MFAWAAAVGLAASAGLAASVGFAAAAGAVVGAAAAAGAASAGVGTATWTATVGLAAAGASVGLAAAGAVGAAGWPHAARRPVPAVISPNLRIVRRETVDDDLNMPAPP